METTNDTPTPPEDLPDPLVEILDTLEVPALRSVQTYIRRSLEHRRPPIAERILAEACGDVVDIEDRGAYALVRMRPPVPDGPGAHDDVRSLYHVRHEPRPDGGESLHWSFVGDVRETRRIECETCGTTLEGDREYCPHCDSDEIRRYGGGE